MEHYLALTGAGSVSGARPISWLYRPLQGVVSMDLAIDSINLLSLDRGTQYGYQYPGGIILYPGAVFRGTHIGNTITNLIQANNAQINTLNVMSSTGDTRFYATFLFPSTTAVRTITIPDVTGNLGILSGIINNNDCVKSAGGALASTGAPVYPVPV